MSSSLKPDMSQIFISQQHLFALTLTIMSVYATQTTFRTTIDCSLSENLMENNIIEVCNVTKVLGGHAVLSDINFQVPKGSIYGILGPNGSGKTTLLRILLGLIMPDTGDVMVLGQNPLSMTREVKNGIGFVLEDHGLNERLTAYQNIDFFAQVYGLAKVKRRARILVFTHNEASRDFFQRDETTTIARKGFDTRSKNFVPRRTNI
jgi:ABC-type molybdenum transport system ATPase subunit/photorepair protein PhrA